MLLQRLAFVIGGFAAGALLRRLNRDQPVPQRSLDRLARELRAASRAQENRIGLLEARAAAHDSQLKEIPSSAQLLSSIDDLLAKAMATFEGKLATQARSIETLQMTVAQTDDLLQRVLESLDTLRENQ